jgi:hypothetical protein
MNIEMKNIGQHIDLGDNIKLVYQEPEVFSRYYAVVVKLMGTLFSQCG